MTYDHLKLNIDAAVQFAEQYPTAFQATILSFILSQETSGHLLSAGLSTISPNNTPNSPIHSARPVAAGALRPAVAPERKNEARLSEVIAGDAEISEALVLRVFSFEPNGETPIRAILEESSLARRQIGYTVLHLFARVLRGIEGATSDELRGIMQAKKCYDTPNFTRNLKASKFVKAYGAPGKGKTEWLLTEDGRQEARRLLKELSQSDVSQSLNH